MNLSIKKMPADKGMRFVTSMIKTGYISECSGICVSYISRGMTHVVMNGTPYYYRSVDVQLLQQTIKCIGKELLDVTVEDNGQVTEQIKELRKKICIPYIFQVLMGKSKAWQRIRISVKAGHKSKSGKTYTMLNKFTHEDVEQINDAIRTIALTLCSIELTEDYEPIE